MAIDAKHFDPATEANNILCEHTAAFMEGIHAEYDSNEQMYDCTVEECAFILTTNLVEGKYTPMQFNAVRNELAKLLWSIFEAPIKAEEEAKAMEDAIAVISVYMK